jgi:hypothetical protein
LKIAPKGIIEQEGLMSVDQQSTIEFRWEEIASSVTSGTGVVSKTKRAKVFGGWMVKDYEEGAGTSMTFIPDPDHQWVVKPVDGAGG